MRQTIFEKSCANLKNQRKKKYVHWHWIQSRYWHELYARFIFSDERYVQIKFGSMDNNLEVGNLFSQMNKSLARFFQIKPSKILLAHFWSHISISSEELISRSATDGGRKSKVETETRSQKIRSRLSLSQESILHFTSHSHKTRFTFTSQEFFFF